MCQSTSGPGVIQYLNYLSRGAAAVRGGDILVTVDPHSCASLVTSTDGSS